MSRFFCGKNFSSLSSFLSSSLTICFSRIYSSFSSFFLLYFLPFFSHFHFFEEKKKRSSFPRGRKKWGFFFQTATAKKERNWERRKRKNWRKKEKETDRRLHIFFLLLFFVWGHYRHADTKNEGREKSMKKEWEKIEWGKKERGRKNIEKKMREKKELRERWNHFLLYPLYQRVATGWIAWL